MGRDDVREMLIDIPAKMCRKMSHKFIDSILKEQVKDLSLHHFMILKLLSESERLYVTEIVDCLGIQRSQMTASADKLITLGYIDRFPDVEDRRKVNLFITEKGKLLIGEVIRQIRRKIEKTLLRLSSQEIRVLENGLEIFMKLCSLCKEIEDGEGV